MRPSHMKSVGELTIAVIAVHLDQVQANGGRFLVHEFLGYH